MPSEVWQHFEKLEGNKFVVCNVCQAKLPFSGNTTNLRDHLKRWHSSLLSASSTSKVQQEVPRYFAKKVDPSRAKEITNKIVDVVVDGLPISIVEKESFKTLIKNIAPGYQLPCRKTVSKILSERHVAGKRELTQKLTECDSLSITTDAWTSLCQEAYLAVTCHHVGPDWKLKTNLLATRPLTERHTAVNLAEEINATVAEYDLSSKLVACVHDNAANVCRAMPLLKGAAHTGQGGVFSVNCAGHTLNLCIQHGLEGVRAVNTAVAAARRLVGHLKKK